MKVIKKMINNSEKHLATARNKGEFHIAFRDYK